MNVYLDIETIAAKEVPAEFLKVDARLKDPAKIALAKIAALDKTVFSGDFGEIVSIAAAVDEGQIWSVNRDDAYSEEDLLNDFMNTLDSEVAVKRQNATADEYEIKWVGHHIPFDLSFLHHRNMIHQITNKLRMPWPVNPWDKNIGDTQHMWAGKGDFVSLDKLCFILFGERKTTTGGDVAGMWERSEFDKIAEYNRDDVKKARQVYKRLIGEW